MLQRCVVDVFMSYACVNHACSTPKPAAIPKMFPKGMTTVDVAGSSTRALMSLWNADASDHTISETLLRASQEASAHYRGAQVQDKATKLMLHRSAEQREYVIRALRAAITHHRGLFGTKLASIRSLFAAADTNTSTNSAQIFSLSIIQSRT